MKVNSSVKTIKFAFCMTVFAVFFLILSNFASAAWETPTQPAPGGNTSPALNTTASAQTKQGQLTIGGNLILSGDNFLLPAFASGVYWGSGLITDPHVDYADNPAKKLYLTAGNGNDGVEFQGDVYITESDAGVPGNLTLNIATLPPGGCTGNSTIKVDANGKVVCVADNIGGSGTMTGLGQSNKVAVFQDASAITYDDLFHWDLTNHRLGVGTNNPQTTLQVNGSVRFASLQNCNSIDTVNGTLQCGTDEGGATGLWEQSAGTGAWSALGSGTNQEIFRLTVFNNDIIIGGLFTQAGGQPANHIARWNGSAWSTLGSGMNDDVRALTVFNNELIAGGQFSVVDGQPTNHIAKWNGSAWSALGLGIDGGSPLTGVVDSFVVYNNELVAGGEFFFAGGQPANNIAKWNGSAWSTLGTGTEAGKMIRSLIVHNGELYAAGGFTQAGGQPANHIAKWNGSAWSALGSGTSGGTYNGEIFGITVYNNELIACGGFNVAGGQPAFNIAKWNGTTWSPLGSGMPALQTVYAVTVHNGYLYAGGNFTQAGGQPANYIAKWNGSAWSAVGSGMDNYIFSFAVLNNELIAGGNFTQAGGQPAANIAKLSLPSIINPVTPAVTKVAIGHQAVVDNTQLSIKSNSVNAAIYGEQMNPSGYAGSFSGRLVVVGNLGIGDDTPAALLTVGAGDTFQVDAAGNVVKIKNIGYSWPSNQGAADTFLKNDGSGGLSWAAGPSGVGGSGANTRVAFWTNGTTLGSSDRFFWDNTNARLDIGDPLPPDNALSVGDAHNFGVDSAGNMVKIYGKTYSWPANQGAADTYLRNDGNGTLAWVAGVGDAFKVEVSGDDLVPDFLSPSLTAGANISYSVQNPAANEQLLIDTTGTSDMPAGASGQTIRHNGTAWIATSNLTNDGTNVGINQTAPTGRFVINQNQVGAGSAVDAIDTFSNSANSAIYAQQNGAGYAGYFSGKTVVMNGNVGVNIESPDQKFTQIGGNMVHRYAGAELPVLATYNPGANSELTGMHISGKYLYASYLVWGFDIIDISNPANLVRVGRYNGGCGERGIVVAGQYAYLGCGVTGLRIVNISNPSAPVATGTYNSPDAVLGVYIAGKYAYIADHYAGMKVVDISNPAAPSLVGSVDTNRATGIYVSGRYAYVADDVNAGAVNGGLRIIDVSNPAAPAIVGQVTTVNRGYNDIYVSGRYAYLSVSMNTSGIGEPNMVIYDISNPTSPTQVGTYGSTHDSFALTVSGKYAYLSTDLYFGVVDVSNPAAPVSVGWTSSGPNHYGVAIAGKYAYGGQWTGATGLVKVVDINGLDTPAISTGSVVTGQLLVDENMDVGNSLTIRTGLNVGRRGIKSDGPIQAGDFSFWNRYYLTERDENGIAVRNPDNADILSFTESGAAIGRDPMSEFQLTVGGNVAATQIWREYPTDLTGSPIEQPLELLQALGAQLSANDNTGPLITNRSGLKAEDIERVLPQVIKTTPSGEKVIDYSQLIPILVEAVKTQQKQIIDLRTLLQKHQ